MREYPLLSLDPDPIFLRGGAAVHRLVRTPQEMRQFYLSPLGKRFYSTLYSPNMNDVTFPLSLQKFILGIFTIQNLTFWIINPLQKTPLLALTPQKTPRAENLSTTPL